MNDTSICRFFLCSIADTDKNSTVSEKDRILQEKEAEIRHMQELLAVMQAQMQQQQPWSNMRLCTDVWKWRKRFLHCYKCQKDL